MPSSKTSTLAKFGLAGAALGTAVSLTLTNLTVTNVNGSVVKATGSFTGATLQVNDTTGSGAINVFGPDGGGMCFFDLDAGGWTICSYLNGAQLCSVAAAGACPRI